MDKHETNRAVAKALGYVIVPAIGADCRTYVTGETNLFSHNGCLWTDPDTDYADAWSPATDPADALAALKAFSHSWMLEQGGTTGVRCWVRGIEGQGESECEAICKAIILAAEAAHG